MNAINGWKVINYLRNEQTQQYEYQVKLPEPLASWDVYDYWEKERTLSMRDNLEPSDLLVDIGAEMGWQTVVYATMCGLVVVEPTKAYWSNIRQTWLSNIKPVRGLPVACYAGLLGNEDRNNPEVIINGWPEAPDELLTTLTYTYIHEHKSAPQMKLDTLVKRLPEIPTAITMDIEGGELLVLQGGENFIREHKPKIWVSVHPDLAEKHYGFKPNEIHDYMKSLGYTGKHLATDHESHWYFSI